MPRVDLLTFSVLSGAHFSRITDRFSLRGIAMTKSVSSFWLEIRS